MMDGQEQDSQAHSQPFLLPQQCILSVLCCIHIFGRGTKDRNTHIHKCLCKLNGCLSTKLHNCPIRFFNVNYVLNILRCKRLKIKLISNVKVSTYCLRVVINYYSFIAFSPKCPCTMPFLRELSDTASFSPPYTE